jgi:Leucine-rich repeat (LRR) protein
MKRLQNLLGGCVLLFLFSVIEGRASSIFYEEEHDFVFPERAQLWQRVLAVTEAERDWIREANAHTRLSFKYPHQLLFYPPNEDEKSLFTETLAPEHWVFLNLDKLLQSMRLSLEKVSEPYYPFIKKVIKTYNNFKKKLINGDNDTKGKFLEHKVSLIGEDGLYYLISQEIARSLVSKDKYGFKDKQNDTGMRSVRASGGVHFKFLDESPDPPRPGQEFMAYALAKSITEEELLTPSLLLKLEGVSILSPSDEGFPLELIQANVKVHGKTLEEALADLHLSSRTGWQEHVQPKNHTFFVQASQTIGTRDLAKHLEKNPLLPVDPVNLSWHHVLTILMAPGDGKADNYSVDMDEEGIARIVGIDNDKIFYPPLYRSEGNIYAGINSIFYAWEQQMDTPLHREVIESVLGQEGTLVVLKWLGILQRQKQVYQKLRSTNRISWREYKELALELPLVTHYASELCTKWQTIQNLLKDRPHQKIHHFLKRFHPSLASYYSELCNLYPHDPLAVMYVAYKGKNESGDLQTMETILDNLNIEEFPSQRVPRFTQPLEKGFEGFISQILFEDFGSESQRDILELLCQYFPQKLSTFFQEVPAILWHTMVRINASDRVLEFLYKLIPRHINTVDEEKTTPLDRALTVLMATGEGRLFAWLIEMGASHVASTSQILKAYRWIKKNGHEEIQNIFKVLQRRNQKVDWTITLEELFPPYERKGEFVTNASQEQRCLLPALQEQLEDPNRAIFFGRREVYRIDLLGQTVYLKFFPELPGLEEAIGDLTRRTIGFGAPHGDLFRWVDGRPVWISQGVEGKTLETVLRENPQALNNLDPVSTAQMILMAMLTNPEDGKPDNYIVSSLPDTLGAYRLICVDNDHGFVPAFVRETPEIKGFANKKVIPVAQVKTILYCLPHMLRPLPDIVREQFLEINIDDLLKGWLYHLDTHNTKYKGLYDDDDFDLVTDLLENHESFIGIPFQQGAIAHLYSKFLKLQDILEAIPSLTPLMLLAKLEPRLAKRYAPALLEELSIKERFDKVDSGFYEKNRSNNKLTTISKSNTILESMGIPFKKETLEAIRNHEEFGPKQALEELKAIQEQKTSTLPSFENILLDRDLEERLKEFDFSGYSSTELRNILEPIYSRGLPILTIKNAQNFNTQDFTDKAILGNLTRLDLRDSHRVNENLIVALANQAFFLEYLNLAGCPDTKWVAQGLVLGYDYIPFPNLQYLNVSGCPSLQAIKIRAPQLTKVWAEKCPVLNLFMVEASNLQSLNIKKCKGLSQIGDIGVFSSLPLRYPHLTSLNCEKCTHLQRIYIESPSLTYANLTNCIKLTKSNLYEGILHIIAPLQTLKLDGCENIKIYNVNNGYSALVKSYAQILPTQSHFLIHEILNKNEKIELSSRWDGWDSLDMNYCLWILSTSNVTVLDLSGARIGDIGAGILLPILTNITSLSLRKNDIGDRGVGSLSGLRINLTSLDLSVNDVGDKGVTNLSRLTNLTYLNLCNNNIGYRSSESLSKLTNLTSLSLGVNSIGGKGVTSLSRLTNLTYLNLEKNNINIFDDKEVKNLSRLTNLTSLNLQRNGLFKSETLIHLKNKLSHKVVKY